MQARERGFRGRVIRAEQGDRSGRVARGQIGQRPLGSLPYRTAIYARPLRWVTRITGPTINAKAVGQAS